MLDFSHPLLAWESGVLGIALLACFCFWGWSTFSRRCTLPGPRGLPFIGHLLSMPQNEEWLYWSKLSRRYGPVFCVHVLGQPIVVLNSIGACTDLLEKCSSVYSGRPDMQFVGRMVGWDRQLIFTGDNERLRVMRRILSRHIGTRSAVSEYQALLELEARRFLASITRSANGAILKDIRLAISAMFLKISHGYNVERESSDPLISLIERAAREFYIAATPGVWLVDLFPIIQYLPRWLPGTRFMETAEQLRVTCEKQTTVPLEFVKDQIKDKKGVSCFTSHVLEADRTELEDEVYPYVTTSMYAGGQDTVSGTLGAFFLAMLLYPDVQHKAQAEIDQVLGSRRFPSPVELDRLPYLQAVLKEVLRWHTIGGMNIPHVATKDDVYMGCRIPEGSIILCNFWNIAYDSKIYDQPTIFKPERFLGPSPEMDPQSYIFGFGKRRCPGIELARRSCVFFIASSLAMVEVVKARDNEGKEIIPPPEFTPGTVRHAKPFPYQLRPRSEDCDALLRMWAEEPCDVGDGEKLKM